MEALLHYIWQYRLGQISTSGEGQLPLEVLDPGEHNLDAGPDFFNAKVRLGDIVWAGCVEIHQRSSQWRKHGHHQDPAYNAVILHVVEVDDEPTYTEQGSQVMTATISIPSGLRERASYLTCGAPQLACSPLGTRLPQELITSELKRLYHERLHNKAEQILRLWQETQDWYETLYITLARSMGMGLNGEAMERLARSLPLRSLRKQGNRPDQVEALLLGQAGLLSSLPEGVYRKHLEGEYAFLKKKYELPEALPYDVWRRMRTRPYSFPVRRLVQLSCLLCSESFSVDSLLRADNRVALEALWDTEREPSEGGKLLLEGVGMRLSKSAKHILILNIVLPFRLAWAMYHGKVVEETPRLYTLATSLPSESNRYTRLFGSSGIEPAHAADGQALLQRYRDYCSVRKCIFCSWGRYLLACKEYIPWRL